MNAKTFIALATLCLAAAARAQPPADWPLHSSGAPDMVGSWTLHESGYIGTYFRLAAPGTITVSIDGAQVTPNGPAPTINIAIAGKRFPAKGEVKFDLPAGTFFCRVEVTNGVPTRFTDITLKGADLLPGNADASALAAADTFIQTGRKSAVSVELPDLAPGTVVHVRQTDSAFHFGANASGATNVLLAPNPSADSSAAGFQATFPTLFNTVVPSNAAKWGYCEQSPGVVTMEYPDAILAFAKSHGMFARMHNLIWDTTQQPKWAQDLMDKAAAGDAAAKDELRKAISRRIGYYVRDRAAGYGELDVLNESLHKSRYMKIFGTEGVAAIYAKCADAIRAAGANTLTCVNEYNVLQYSRDPLGPGNAPFDPYSNWYRAHVEALNNAGAKIGAIGVQYYANPNPQVSDPHHAAHIRQVFESLAVTGLPISLTEFGIKKGGTEEQTRQAMLESLRLAYGSPDVSGFLFFGFWQRAMWDQAPAAMLCDENFRLTPLGEAYAKLRREWTTETDATVDASHHIRFTGFQGTYAVTSGTKTGQLQITPDAEEYRVAIR